MRSSGSVACRGQSVLALASCACGSGSLTALNHLLCHCGVPTHDPIVCQSVKRERQPTVFANTVYFGAAVISGACFQ